LQESLTDAEKVDCNLLPRFFFSFTIILFQACFARRVFNFMTQTKVGKIGYTNINIPTLRLYTEPTQFTLT